MLLRESYVISLSSARRGDRLMFPVFLLPPVFFLLMLSGVVGISARNAAIFLESLHEIIVIQVGDHHSFRGGGMDEMLIVHDDSDVRDLMGILAGGVENQIPLFDFRRFQRRAEFSLFGTRPGNLDTRNLLVNPQHESGAVGTLPLFRSSELIGRTYPFLCRRDNLLLLAAAGTDVQSGVMLRPVSVARRMMRRLA